jgi:HAD superfamily hydrolase (TIGR01509 family)
MEKYNDVELIVFDFDGTLFKLKVDWESLKKELRNYLKEAYGTEVALNSLHSLLDQLSRLGEQAKQEGFRIIRKYELQNIENAEPLPDMLGLAEKLKLENKKLALFSSSTRESIIAVLTKFKKLHLFEVIVGLEDVERIKPDPQGLVKILRVYNVDPKRVLYIGNRDIDLDTGNRVGVRTWIRNC